MMKHVWKNYSVSSWNSEEEFFTEILFRNTIKIINILILSNFLKFSFFTQYINYIMELINTNDKYSFDPTPKLKSSPVPILFVSFNSEERKCNYCKSKYSKTLSKQLYCKNCLFDYVNILTDNNIYLDVHIFTKRIRCIEHKLRVKNFCILNIQEWCKSCSEISCFDQIVTGYKHKFCQSCKLCGNYKQCYLISSEWIESTLDKKPISIIYLPWWDASNCCVACREGLKFISDNQKWCSHCFIIYTGCRYCLTTNIIFGITEQSKCRKCKRVIAIDITSINVNLKGRFINHQMIINYINNINYIDNCTIPKFEELLRNNNYFYPTETNKLTTRFISFNNHGNECDYCGNSYSSTLLFKQKYCKYCLYLCLKDLSDKNLYLDMHISNTSNNHCIEHEPRSLDFCIQNIQKWCINCSEILYFKQIITEYSFDMNYYYEKQNEVIKYEKDCKLCGYQQNLSNDAGFSWCSNCYLISSEWIESTLTEKVIPILNLSWWYSNEQCIICKHISLTLSKTSVNCQKWCTNCFTIYIGCKCCLTTNIIFGPINHSQCKKCERISFITIDTENMENFIVSTKVNADNHNQIVNYINNNKYSNLLKLYSFISKLKFFDQKYILYSNLENNENFTIPIIFVPFNENEEICKYCRNRYFVTLLNQKYCKYCLMWYIKFTKFTTQTMVDVHIITINTQCTEHESRKLEFCTKNIHEWCMNCSEISYFKQIITQCSFDVDRRSEIIQSEKCNLCGNAINQQISSMCLGCYSVSSGYIESTLTKKLILILYLPWWDAFSNCIACKQNFEYKSDCQKWCSRCFIIYIGCKYCLTTNIIFGFTNQSQCIKCKRVEPISINGNHNIDEFLNSTINTNYDIANYMNNTNKDNDPLIIYDFIKNKFGISENIKMIKYSETEDFVRIAEGGYGIIYKATWKIDSIYSKVIAVKRFLNSQNMSKDFVNEVNIF
jgi:hypothetical protein